jgi:hypothetical protein
MPKAKKTTKKLKKQLSHFLLVLRVVAIKQLVELNSKIKILNQKEKNPLVNILVTDTMLT